MIVFSPWAFGSTQPWAISCMNFAGYGLGLLWLIRWSLRRRTRGEFWGFATNPHEHEGGRRTYRWAVPALGILTCLILLYTAVSAGNARMRFDKLDGTYTSTYLDAVPWLPSSYDQDYTWRAFWQYLALACAFWSVRDWLLHAGKRRHSTDSESSSRSAILQNPSQPGLPSASWGEPLPPHWRRLLWLICANGAVLALEGILQRLSGTSKLLWLVQPHINTMADAQFGPYAYRSNAASYFNLVWPLCVAFWWIQRQSGKRGAVQARRVGGSAHTLLLPLSVLMAAAPVISISRGGTLICVGLISSLLSAVWIGGIGGAWTQKIGLTSIVLASATLAISLAWKPLAKRFENVFDESMSGRAEIYTNAKAIADDFQWYGTGPGSFTGIYRFYRQNKNMLWQAYCHDDWLELRITFGRIGASLVLGSLALVFLLGSGSGSEATRVLGGTVTLSLAGCLLHAKFDFPLQIHSLQFMFVLQCAMLSSLSPRPFED